ncbi:MAG: gamma-glutamyltransferase [Deltaproteobacteria bacterium]|nr:gamma-glutamyltransferase [Deltaproteobacteria bacterium]
MDLERIEAPGDATDDEKYAVTEGGIVVTAFPLATEAGVSMLKKGGNAVDAACAAAFALSVCEPQSSGLGGQSMALIHLHGRTFAVDGSSRLPSLAHISRIVNSDRIHGYRAATVPSTLAFLGYLHLRYGRLEWSTLIEPAIRIARDGYRISPLQHRLQQRELSALMAASSRSGARYFLKNASYPYDTGDRFVQPDLAALLEIIAERGPREFYLGRIARIIGEDMEANGGLIRTEDLALIPWPIERRPIAIPYRGLSVATMPPPAGGRSLALVLLMLDHMAPEMLAPVTPQNQHCLAEIFRKALLQRRQYPYHPNFYAQAMDDTMVNAGFAAELVKSIRVSIDPALSCDASPRDGGETTHLSVIDDEGNAVAISQSIEAIYGSAVAAQGLGFLYNNYVRTMETKDPGNPYYLRPNAVPYSTVSPSILFRNEKPWIVVGSPGSDRIFSAVAQFLLHVIDGGLSLGEAVDRPRLHCSMGGKISIEAARFDPSVIDHLIKLGYDVERLDSYSFFPGAIYAAMKCQTNPTYQGVAEVRREGSVAGP